MYAGLCLGASRVNFAPLLWKICGYVQKFHKADTVGMKRIVKNRWESFRLERRLELSKLYWLRL